MKQSKVAKYAVSILKEYADTQHISQRHTVDLSPLEGWLIQRLFSTQLGWISVEDRMPEYYTTVLICDREGHAETNYYDSDFEVYIKNKKVTHWMPLPKCPTI